MPGPFFTPTRQELRQLAKELSRRRDAQRHSDSAYETLARPWVEGSSQSYEYDRVQKHKQQREALLQELETRAAHIHPIYAVDPEGLFRRMWDTVAVSLIFFLAWYLPLLIGFFGECGCCYLHFSSERKNDRSGLATSLSDGYQVILILTNAFFLVDIFLNFFTGVASTPDGPVDYALPVMWSSYVRGWFWLDALACIPLQCMLNGWAPHVYWWNTGYLVRMLRAFGISRRCRGSPFRWIDRFSTARKEFSFSLRRLVLSSVASLYACHIFSCLEWWTLRLEHAPPATFPEQGQLAINEKYVTQHYLWTMFNSISAMIMLTYGSYPPISYGEAIVWTFMMVIVASVFLVDSGQYVPYIMSMAVKRAEFKLQMDSIMAAVESRKLPQRMAALILEHLRLKLKFTGLTNHDGLWQELPFSMQVELADTVGNPVLSTVPLFRRFPALRQRSCLVLKDVYALAGEELVKEGWPSRTMYFVQSGVVLLFQDDMVVEAVLPGQCFGGDALLLLPSEGVLQQGFGISRQEVTRYADSFEALASAKAAVDCRLLSLERSDFLPLSVDEPQACKALDSMAKRHVQRILKSGVQRTGTHPFSATASLSCRHGSTVAAELRARLTDRGQVPPGHRPLQAVRSRERPRPAIARAATLSSAGRPIPEPHRRRPRDPDLTW